MVVITPSLPSVSGAYSTRQPSGRLLSKVHAFLPYEQLTLGLKTYFTSNIALLFFRLVNKPDNKHPAVVVVSVHSGSLQAGFLMSKGGEI